MASQGKKGKKFKGKTVNLSEYLSEGKAPGDEFTTVVAPKSSWADEMDEMDEYSGSSSYRSTPAQIVLPTAPRAARGPAVSDDRIPREPPYTAYVANLPYDIDESDLESFFSKLNLKEVRLPRDGDPESGRLKGYGYADFHDRDSLVEALTMSDQQIRNRQIRIDLASGGRSDSRRTGGRYDREPEEDRTIGDWRSAPREMDPPPSRGGRDYDRRDYDRRDGGSRDYDRRDGSGRDYDRRDGGGRGFDRYEAARDRYDRGASSSRYSDRGYGRDDRRDNYDTGFDRSQMRGSRDRDDRGGDRYGSGDRYHGGSGGRYDRFDSEDRYGRRDNRGGGYGRDEEREPPRERRRLQLTKRTVPVDTEKDATETTASSIFGGAKPVDTTKKEKEIEEKLEKKRQEPEAPKKPSSTDIFGAAKPVDTAAREREIEERLQKKREEEAERQQKKREEETDRPRRDHRDEESERPVQKKQTEEQQEEPEKPQEQQQEEETEEDKRFNSVKGPAPKKVVEEKKPLDIVSSNKFQFLQEDEGNGSESGQESE